MALELVTVSLNEPDPELHAMAARFWISAALTVPVVVAAMAEMVSIPGVSALGARAVRVIQAALAAPVVFWCGAFVFQRAGASIIRRRPNMFTLIGLGTSVAYGYSLLVTVWPQAVEHAGSGHVGVYFEASAMIMTLVLLGQVLELRARRRTRGAIEALLALAPNTARVIRDDGREEDVPLAEIRVGDRLRVRPGERVPVDGVILEGSGVFDESMFTGESLPTDKQPGGRVIGGTVQTTGSIVIRAERIGDDTLLAHIVRMVTEAQRSRASIERLVDIVSAIFVQIVIGIAIVTALVWGVAGPEPRLTHAIVHAVAVLIIACPCALGLATPMSIMVAAGRGAQAGIVIRNAEALERFERIETLVMDKTGTLTEGKPQLTGVVVAPGFDEVDVLSLAASLERHSEHSLAVAIVEGAARRRAAPHTVEEFRMVPGHGVMGRVAGRVVILGNRAFLAEQGVATDPLEAQAEALRRAGQSVMFVAVDGQAAGCLAVSDPIKASSFDAVTMLHRDGVRLIMATGDHRTTADAVARRLGIDEVFAEQRPEEKRELVRRLQGEGRRVAMAGDGINDAPALAQADVSIAMGTGTDVAIESADLTLVKGDLRGVAKARRLSRATMRNIRQNLFFALAYNALGIPIAAGVLYPVSGVILSPVVAGAAMSLSSVSVIANALRLRRARV